MYPVSRILSSRALRNKAASSSPSPTLPEFAVGASTFNTVFGRTHGNPWNTSLTCGGSSGGAAVSVATGEAWLAHGNDMNGSLRRPATYCGVVGLRPSPGRVTRGTVDDLFSPLMVEARLHVTFQTWRCFSMPWPGCVCTTPLRMRRQFGRTSMPSRPLSRNAYAHRLLRRFRRQSAN
ncbi:amidase family protein [Cupriavidus basilensis]